MKKVLGFLAVTLVGGVLFTVSPISWANNQVTTAKQHVSKQEKKEQRKEEVAKKIADYLGISKEEVTVLMKKERHLVVAAVISKLSKQPIGKVVEAKKTEKTWKKVAEKYKIDRKQIKQEIHKLFPDIRKGKQLFHKQPKKVFDLIASYLGVKKDEVVLIWSNNKIHAHGIVKAAMIAKVSGKSLEEVVKLKQEKKTWKEVAAALNVKPEQLKAEAKKLKEQLKKKGKENKNQ
ncbi:hypothetical protein [Thermoflavimicrobium dichotomicum]|uniref:Uncharacterized protein n=1 Tax=Thermoflavimicrobium dichotomicum TaxID=46223 RepID=A0A1I3MJ63_9BACL|nr:hypothetical protein [Thermoflavimicrobium dichotomicum]SFI97184.1 hypothetical protein SAMN05421852_10396 [Thermoflavimicrobium dichotomicum]